MGVSPVSLKIPTFFNSSTTTCLLTIYPTICLLPEKGTSMLTVLLVEKIRTNHLDDFFVMKYKYNIPEMKYNNTFKSSHKRSYFITKLSLT